MPTDRVIDVLSAIVREPDGRSDSDLIASFVSQRSEAAFAELLHRHGPNVFGVCRRMLGHTQDAEDAFQAVFIVLAKRATTIRQAGQLGGWLYGVAVRTALKARTMAARRQRRELASARSEAVEDMPDTAELRRIVDEELAQLAKNHRAVIVLCDLNGESRSVASRSLGWPEGTVAARLAKARQLLASRLSRRGVTLAAGGLSTMLAAQNVAAVPVSTAARAMAISVGSVGVSPASQVLAEKVMRSMFWSHLTFPAFVSALCCLSMALVLAVGQMHTVSDSAESAAPRREAQPMIWTSELALELKGWMPGSVAFCPDGKQMLIAGTGGHVEAYKTANWKKDWDLRADTSWQSSVAYSADGKMLAATDLNGFHLLNPSTGKVESFFEEKGNRPLAVGFFPDEVIGDGANTVHKVMLGNDRGYSVKTWIDPTKASTIKLSTGEPGKQQANYTIPLAVDPQGKRVACTGPIDRATNSNVFWAWAAGSGEGNKLLEGHQEMVTAAAWAYDGKTIVTGDAAGKVIRWDAAAFKQLSHRNFSGKVVALTVSRDGERLAAAVIGIAEKKESYNEEVYIWPTENAPEKLEPLVRKSVSGSFAGLAGLAFAPDGKTLASSFCDLMRLAKPDDPTGQVRLWRLTPKP